MGIKKEKEQKFVSAIAYVHDSSAEIASFLDKVMGTIDSSFDKCELIFVDDCSTDDSVKAIHRYYDEHIVDYMVTILKTGCYQGTEFAMNAGRDMAIGDYVFEFDDLVVDYDSSVIMECFGKCQEGNDIVTAVSNEKIRLTSRLFYSLFNRTSQTRNMLGQSTFTVLSRRAINRVKSLGSYIPYRKAAYMNCGLAAATVKYASTGSGSGVTAHSQKGRRASLAMDSFIYYTDLMEKFSLVISVIAMIMVLGVVIYVVSSFFTDSHLTAGWVSTVGFMSLGFMGVFGLLTVILKYLSVITNLVFRNQRCLVEEIEKISRN